MDAATIATQVVGLSLVAGVVTQFTKAKVSTDSRVRTVWALAVAATVAIVGVAVSGLLAWLAGDDLTGRALVAALVVQIPAVIGGAQAIYAAVHAIVPGSQNVDVEQAVEAVKTIAATVAEVTTAADAADAADSSEVSNG